MTIPQENSIFIYSLYVCIFFGCITFVCLLIDGYLKNKKYKKVTWQRTDAIVQKTDIEMRSRGRVGGFNYGPVITYSYAYEGRNYVSSTLSPELTFPFSGDSGYAKKWIELFPPHTKIAAYVDPKNPSNAVLFPDYRHRWLYDSFLYALAMVGFFNLIFLVLFFSLLGSV